ncbi:hypothetical protein TYRP_000956 [Tyrophagus putrescentiae]|nr:hypothetical protein TYRP_000956 [Tyrophagus putrescentiae]
MGRPAWQAVFGAPMEQSHLRVLGALFLPLLLCLFASTADGAGVRKVSSSISCFVCSSSSSSSSGNATNITNLTNSDCHDPFQPRDVFPARFCVKVTGKLLSTGHELIIRACSLESMDNQCGLFKFENEVYKGCILTCDYDGCNSATRPYSMSSLLGHLVVSLLSLRLMINC